VSGTEGVIDFGGVPFIHNYGVSGSYNSFFGRLAGNLTNTGSYLTALGDYALTSDTSGSDNTAVGFNAGAANTTGSNNTYLGYQANPGSNNLSNATAIGANATVSESSALVLGGTGVNAVSVGIGTATPAYTLDVQGEGNFNAAASTALIATSSNSYGVGVLGLSASTTPGFAVYGQTLYSGGIGVYGLGVSGSNTGEGTFGLVTAGVWGDTNQSIFAVGVLGTADDAEAGAFSNDSDSYSTLEIQNGGTGGLGDVTKAGAPLLSAYGGKTGKGCTIDTSGTVNCEGTVTAVVPTNSGERKVSLYAVQSPENWFEDFGSGALSNGAATIALDPTFAQTVNTGTEYHVFLTPNGDSKGLYVSRKTATSFEVREQGGGQSSIAFDYRIVAKRSGYENVRLTDVTEQYKKMEEQREVRRGRPGQRPVRPSSIQPSIPAPHMPPLRAAAQPTIAESR
jgi:hypothetical protein